MPNGHVKQSLIEKVKEVLPDVPKWMTYEEHVKTAQKHVKELVVGVAPGDNDCLNHKEQPQE